MLVSGKMWNMKKIREGKMISRRRLRVWKCIFRRVGGKGKTRFVMNSILASIKNDFRLGSHSSSITGQERHFSRGANRAINDVAPCVIKVKNVVKWGNVEEYCGLIDECFVV